MEWKQFFSVEFLYVWKVDCNCFYKFLRKFCWDRLSFTIRSTNTSGCLLKIDCSEERKIVTSPSSGRFPLFRYSSTGRNSQSWRVELAHRSTRLSTALCSTLEVTGYFVTREIPRRWCRHKSHTSWGNANRWTFQQRVAHAVQLLYCIFYGNKVLCNTVSRSVRCFPPRLTMKLLDCY